MKTYVDYSQSPDGWNVSATLELEDDGRFRYEELWTDYTNASLGGGAEGRWRRDGGVVVFLAERVEGSMYHGWVAGGELEAFERGDTIDFGGGLTLRVPPERVVKSPVRNAGSRPPAVVPEPRGARHKVAPVAETAFAKFEPLKPSPELAARLRRRVEELPASDKPDWLKRLCAQNDSIPLHSTQIYLWVLRPDGQLLCIDHESFSQRAEPETGPLTAYAVLKQGELKYPEIGELLPPPPAGTRRCEPCGGRGWTEAQPPAKGTEPCFRCNCLGWYAPGVLY